MDLDKEVDKIPPGGWWDMSSRATYIRLAERLTELGLEPEEALDILDGAFHAAAAEYGD